MAREKCGHQRLALAFFSICPLCACIVWLGLGSEFTVDFSLQWIFAPPTVPRQFERGYGCLWWNILGDGSNCLIRFMDRIYGTGLAFMDNVHVAFIYRKLE